MTSTPSSTWRQSAGPSSGICCRTVTTPRSRTSSTSRGAHRGALGRAADAQGAAALRRPRRDHQARPARRAPGPRGIEESGSLPAKRESLRLAPPASLSPLDFGVRGVSSARESAGFASRRSPVRSRYAPSPKDAGNGAFRVSSTGDHASRGRAKSNGVATLGLDPVEPRQLIRPASTGRSSSLTAPRERRERRADSKVCRVRGRLVAGRRRALASAPRL